MKARIALFVLVGALASAPAAAEQLVLANPVSVSVTFDRVEILSYEDVGAVGSARVVKASYAVERPVNVSTNGVRIVGVTRLNMTVEVSTAELQTGEGRAWDELTRNRQELVLRRVLEVRVRQGFLASRASLQGL